MRIGLVEFLLILAIASLTVGPQVALFVDRWMRRANRVNARAARRRAEYAAQMAAERDALLKRFRTASTVFGVGILLALVYALVFRPIDTPPQAYTAPEVRQSTGAVQTALSADSRDVLALGDYQGVDCIREQDGFVYAAAYNGATLKKRKSDLVRTDGGSFSAILSVDGELTGFAFDADGDLWLTVLTPGGGALCRARHDSWGAAVEQVVTQIDGAPLGAVSAVEAGPDGKVYFAVAGGEAVDNGLEAALRTELLAHTGTGWVYVYDPADRSVQRVVGGVAGASGLALSPDGRTLYVSDLGNRCVWSMDADARELTAGGKKLPKRLFRPAGLPRCTGHGSRRHPVHQLPLGPQRLAGKERGQHPAAGHRPAGGSESAGKAVRPVVRRSLRGGGEHRRRQLEAGVYRRQQLHGGVPGGQQSVFWRGGQRTGAVGTHLKTEVF